MTLADPPLPPKWNYQQFFNPSLIHIFYRNFNFKFPDENILHFLHGLDPVQSQGCLNINFGSQKSEDSFSFSQLPMIPEGLSQEKIRNTLKNIVFNCYIVSIGKKYIQVENAQ